MTNKLPTILKKELKHLTEEIDSSILKLLSSDDAQKVLSCSQFVADYCQRNPEALKDLVKAAIWKARLHAKNIHQD